MRTIDEILKTNGHTPRTVTPDSSVISALKLMAEEQEEALPVLEAGKLVGVICEKDCIAKVILNGRSKEEPRVTEIMTRNIPHFSPGQSIEECLDVMTEKHIQYLPIMSETSFVGFVSMSDIFRTIIDDQKGYIYRLENFVLGADYGK
jgi:CBS domain-containing protein